MTSCPKFTHYYKQITSVLVGLCLGIALNLILTPFEDEECFLGMSGNSRRAPKSVEDDEYNPRLVPIKVKSPAGGPIQISRPRYVSTELGIREKLFVGVLTSRDTIETMGVAINKTLTHHVNKVVFFMESTEQPNLNTPMTVVGFSDDRTILKPFHMVRYIADHYLNEYDYFYIMSDMTYVRGERLVDFLNHVSISEEIYMGMKTDDDDQAVYCSLGAGIVFSSSILRKIIPNLDWCTKNAFSQAHDDNLGRCVLHSTGHSCTEHIMEKYYQSFHLDDTFDASTTMDQLGRKESFNSALTVYPVSSAETIYRLHIYFCRQDLAYTRKVISEIQEQVVNMSYLTPGGRSSATWPIGVQEPFDAKARFDIMRYDYFTEKYIYLDNDYNSISPLVGVHRQDVQQVLNKSIAYVQRKFPTHKFRRLVNGYRRFDPTRGMEYILDVAFHDKAHEKEVHKRVLLVRPLSHVEIIPMPYVTENTRITLVLPVTEAEKDDAVTFLDNYAQTCLETQDNTVLMLVFVYDVHVNPGDFAKEDDPYTVVKSMISYHENKYKGAKIAWVSVHSRHISQFIVMDIASKKFLPDTLFLLCSTGMQLSAEFLNRVRMNTIRKWQVFFPLPFYQYKPDLVYSERPYPSSIEINKNVGHFDWRSYDHAAFYNDDYMTARQNIANDIPILDSLKQSAVESQHTHANFDLFSMFLISKLNVFRAVEPALKHKFRLRTCNPLLSENLYNDCIQARQEGLASRSQLAMLIFEQQLHMDSNQNPRENQQLKANDK